MKTLNIILSLFLLSITFLQSEYTRAQSAAAAPSTDKVFIDFVGSGDVQKSISNNESAKANTGIGIIFERSKNNANGFFQSFELESVLNIATTADTIKSNFENGLIQNRRSFGTYLLNPVSAKQSIYINSNFYFGYPNNFLGAITHVISGLNLRFIS